MSPKFKKFISLFPTLVAAFLGSALGTGWWWSFQQAEINRANHGLQVMTQRKDLNEKIVENIGKVSALYKKYDNLLSEALNDKTGTINREIDRMWKYELDVLKSNVQQLEGMLSKLENREPRNFGFYERLVVPTITIH